jgi:hypothetical protein
MERHCLIDFVKGVVCGFIVALVIFGFTAWVLYSRSKDRGLIEYAERQIEIEALREDVINRDPVEFLEVPGVGDAVREARTEFDRKRDEALYRFRSGFVD